MSGTGQSSARSVITAGQEPNMADTSTRLFRASLRGRLYRDIELPSSKSLEDLAAAIVNAFGFDFDHAFGFYSNLKGNYYKSPERYELFADLGEADQGVKGVRRTKVSTTFPQVGKTMLFLFDDGDQWQFKVELIGLGQKEAKVTYPRVVKQVGPAPPQYPDLDEDE
jgi:Plasmid pRiA4b ORF-3-like protein